MVFFSSKTGQFTYFSLQLGEKDWSGKNVLDFGGNIGNMLRDPNCTIDPERYWCLDVVEESIEKGKEMFPQSHWHFYNRYAFFFNPNGTVFLWIRVRAVRFLSRLHFKLLLYPYAKLD